MHVHVLHADGEAKFWMEPMIELAVSAGLSQLQLREAMLIIEGNEQGIRDAWTMHFRY